MRPLTTLILFVISAALGVATWWLDRSASGAAATSESGGGSGRALVRFAAEDLEKITIKHQAGEAVLVSRDGYWHFTTPVADRADPDAMKALLDQLSHLSVLGEIPKDEVGSREELAPEALGLTADTLIRVELTPRAGSDTAPAAILLGNPATLTNSSYARLPDSDVYVVEGQPRAFLNDPVTALRDRHLFLAQADQIVQITVRTAGGEVEMKRRMANPPTGWTLTKPLLTRADNERVDALLASLSALRVESVEARAAASPVPNPVPEGAAVLQIWRYGVEQPLELVFHPTDDEKTIDATVSDRGGFVYRVKSDLLGTLASAGATFRDPRLVRLAPNLVFGIRIDSRGDPPVVLRTPRSNEAEVKWYSERNGQSEPANETQIADLLQALNSEKALAFVSDKPDQLAAYNLADPAVKITLSHYEMQPATAPDGATAGGAGQLGMAQKVLLLGYAQGTAESPESVRLFANVTGEPFILELSPAFREHTPTHPLKWKDLKILSFNPIGLRGVERVIGAQPESRLKLAYDYRGDEWQGADVNKEAMRKLRERLGSLTATRWLTPSPQAFQALETPESEFRVTLEVLDRATGKPVEKSHTLRFSKATEVSYYGRIDESPDLFEIDRETYRDLIAPLLKQRAGAN